MVPADINLVIGHKQAKQDKKKGGGSDGFSTTGVYRVIDYNLFWVSYE